MLRSNCDAQAVHVDAEAAFDVEMPPELLMRVAAPALRENTVEKTKTVRQPMALCP